VSDGAAEQRAAELAAKLARLGVTRTGGARPGSPGAPAVGVGVGAPNADVGPAARGTGFPATSPDRGGGFDAPRATPSVTGPAWVDALPPEVRERLRRTVSAAPLVPPAAPPSKPVPGETVVRAEGRVHVATWNVPRDLVHGAVRLDLATELRSATARVAARDPRMAAADPDRFAFFDTETTSLNSGAGVWVFLVGIGRFVGDAFRVRQFLLPGPDGEAAFLGAVRDELADVDALVSFHGKSFDAPRLDDRCRLASLDELCAGRPHWDLLHAVRRLYGGAWSDCKLRTVEDRLLGFRRTDDLPGAECPAQYFSYLRGGRHRMADVLEHNRLDTVSLAALAGVLASAYHAEDPAPSVALAVGLDWGLVGEAARSAPLLRRGVLAAGQAPASSRDKARRLAKRFGDLATAEAFAAASAVASGATPKQLARPAADVFAVSSAPRALRPGL
jgi:uncharacterized protein YprB with RNaseH-like and TPR domain